MKQCKTCKKHKPLTEFYKLPHMSDGLFPECKDCVKARVKARTDILKQDPAWVEKERARGREKYSRLYTGVKAKYHIRKKSTQNYKIRYPEKQKAKEAAYKFPCKDNHHRHHWSYRKEHYTDFIEIEDKLHYKIHRYMKYIPSEKMYSTIEGTLLDTREKHEAFIESIKKIPY